MITLINPNLIVSKNDVFTTGVVYMPISLAYLAGHLRKEGKEITLIDAFGERPNQITSDGNFLIRGLTPKQITEKIPKETKIIFLYAINVAAHYGLVKILQSIKSQNKDVTIVILENSQAVTSYSLRNLQEEFYQMGANYIITGDLEHRGHIIIEEVLQNNNPKIYEDGIGWKIGGESHYSPPELKKNQNLDELAYPAWDLLPLKNYWKLKYAHGPFETKKYLPLLTSRGCPYPCGFCVIPEVSGQRWRARSAENVVDEIEYFQKTLGVSEFHIEDVDPTVNDGRIKDFCLEILRRKLKIIWKICAGTKVETIRSEETVKLMKKSGCRYVSISPETGSPRVLKMINKPFKLDHAINIVQKMSENGIFTQACFVLGYPGEEDADLELTKKMIHNLTKVGIDEIALFIITPMPGSKIFSQYTGQYKDYSQLNFSPNWRVDYDKLNNFRLHLYRSFMIWKLIYWPSKILLQPFYFLMRKFVTKMEMTPFRAIHTILIRSKFYQNYQMNSKRV